MFAQNKNDRYWVLFSVERFMYYFMCPKIWFYDTNECIVDRNINKYNIIFFC